MGYRSDVAIGIALPNKAAAREFVLKARACLALDDAYDALSEYSVVHDSNAQEPVMFLTHMENVKWYPSYTDVMAHDALRSLAEEAGATTRFVRVGEDLGDDEDVMGYEVDNVYLQQLLQDAIQMRRTVDCDIPPGGGSPLDLLLEEVLI
jgi:hypothetical protein